MRMGNHLHPPFATTLTKGTQIVSNFLMSYSYEWISNVSSTEDTGSSAIIFYVPEDNSTASIQVLYNTKHQLDL
jgi:hypothetical protein